VANLGTASTCDPILKIEEEEEEEEGKKKDDDDESFDPDDEDDRGDDDDDDGDSGVGGVKKKKKERQKKEKPKTATVVAQPVVAQQDDNDYTLLLSVEAEERASGGAFVGEGMMQPDGPVLHGLGGLSGLSSYELAHNPRYRRPGVPTYTITLATTAADIQSFLASVANKNGYDAAFMPTLLQQTSKFSSRADLDAGIASLKASFETQAIFRGTDLIVICTRGTSLDASPVFARVISCMNEPVKAIPGAPSSDKSGVRLPSGELMFGLGVVAPTVYSYWRMLSCLPKFARDEIGFGDISPATVTFAERVVLGPMKASADSKGIFTDYSFSAAKTLNFYLNGGSKVFLLGSVTASHLVGAAVDAGSKSSFWVAFQGDNGGGHTYVRIADIDDKASAYINRCTHGMNFKYDAAKVALETRLALLLSGTDVKLEAFAKMLAPRALAPPSSGGDYFRSLEAKVSEGVATEEEIVRYQRMVNNLRDKVAARAAASSSLGVKLVPSASPRVLLAGASGSALKPTAAPSAPPASASFTPASAEDPRKASRFSRATSREVLEDESGRPVLRARVASSATAPLSSGASSTPLTALPIGSSSTVIASLPGSSLPAAPRGASSKKIRTPRLKYSDEQITFITNNIMVDPATREGWSMGQPTDGSGGGQAKAISAASKSALFHGLSEQQIYDKVLSLRRVGKGGGH
jgi:hypothetical protein